MPLPTVVTMIYQPLLTRTFCDYAIELVHTLGRCRSCSWQACMLDERRAADMEIVARSVTSAPYLLHKEFPGRH